MVGGEGDPPGELGSPHWLKDPPPVPSRSSDGSEEEEEGSPARREWSLDLGGGLGRSRDPSDRSPDVRPNPETDTFTLFTLRTIPRR